MIGLPHKRPLNRRAMLGLAGTGVAALAGCGETTDSEKVDEPEAADEEGQNHSDPDDTVRRERDLDNVDDETERSDASTLLNIRDTLNADNPLFDPESRLFSSERSDDGELSLRSGLTIFAFEHDGTDEFIVEMGGPVSGLIAKTTVMAGASCVAADRGDYSFAVATDSKWSMRVGQPFAPPETIRTPSVGASGEGDTVVGPVELTESTTFISEHESDDGKFVVEVYNENASGGSATEVAFNQLGEYSGKTDVSSAGVAWIAIEADGAWQLNIE